MKTFVAAPHARRLLAVVLLAGCALAALQMAMPRAVQAQGRGVELVGLHGERLGEAELSQGTTLVVFWASWSPRSRDVVDRVNALTQRWGSRARVVTVNFQEDRAAIDGFLAGKSMAAPIFLDADGALSKKYAVATLPGLLILKDGQAAYHGKLPDDPDTVIAGILG